MTETKAIYDAERWDDQASVLSQKVARRFERIFGESPSAIAVEYIYSHNWGMHTPVCTLTCKGRDIFYRSPLSNVTLWLNGAEYHRDHIGK